MQLKPCHKKTTKQSIMNYDKVHTKIMNKVLEIENEIKKKSQNISKHSLKIYLIAQVC